jgi:acyl-CoA thioester hydrolase
VTGHARPMHAVEFRVRYPETDQMGVVYHANYLHWCDIGRTEYLRARGATYADLERNGMLLAVSQASLRYHASARYDQLVRIETTLREVRSRALTFDYVIVDAVTGTRFVSASTVLVSLDAAGRPVQLPLETRELLLRDLP